MTTTSEDSNQRERGLRGDPVGGGTTSDRSRDKNVSVSGRVTFPRDDQEG